MFCDVTVQCARTMFVKYCQDAITFLNEAGFLNSLNTGIMTACVLEVSCFLSKILYRLTASGVTRGLGQGSKLD